MLVLAGGSVAPGWGCSLWPGLGAGGHSPAETQLRTPATGAHIATGLRLLASLLSAAAPGPWDGKNGCPAVQQQPHHHHAAHIVDTGIVLTSPAQPRQADAGWSWTMVVVPRLTRRTPEIL